MAKHFLLTGPPGCGKTTVLRSVLAGLREANPTVALRGFWTEEIRERGTRTGFRIETVSGTVGRLAGVGLRTGHRVGRYEVDLGSFEAVGVAELEAALEEVARGFDSAQPLLRAKPRSGPTRSTSSGQAPSEVEGRGQPIILAIDEIGKMELFSARFRGAVERAFSAVPHVVATIMQRSHPFADALKARADVTVIVVTPQNRDRLPGEIAAQLL